MAALMTPPAARLAAIPPETIVCRCEDVTRAEIDAAFHDGARDMNQLKTRTRCGMGPCQGHVCGPIVAALAAMHPDAAVPLLPWTVRPPLGALPIAALVGDFGYDDIPAVRPAI
jgi:bacterioferritin-associated ferredoxin